MVRHTAIEWTDDTWNPVRGCSRMSEGCRHCYAEQQAARIVRMGKGKPTAYDGLVRLVNGDARWTGVVRLVPDHLADPLRWRKPRRIFVNSMSDLFHESLDDAAIAAVFGVMAAAPHHIFQVLTKRARRMREWFAWVVEAAQRDNASPAAFCFALAGPRGIGNRPRSATDVARAASWPMPNVHLGVSVENQEAADERIPELLETPAAVRFLSCEPLLGPVDLTLRGSRIKEWDEDWKYDTLNGCEWASPHSEVENGSSAGLDWIISGCESGPGARPCDVSWLRSLRDQCAAAGVAYFLKQAQDVGDEGITCGFGSHRKPGGVIGAPYLDGVQHRDFPT